MTDADKIDLLAGKVMGWRKGDHLRWVDAATGIPTADAFHGGSDDYYQPYSAWNPLEEIADAFLVLEKLRERHSNMALFADNGWGLMVWHINVEGEHRHVAGPVNAAPPARAICATALLGVEEADSCRPLPN